MKVRDLVEELGPDADVSVKVKIYNDETGGSHGYVVGVTRITEAFGRKVLEVEV